MLNENLLQQLRTNLLLQTEPNMEKPDGNMSAEQKLRSCSSTYPDKY